MNRWMLATGLSAVTTMSMLAGAAPFGNASVPSEVSQMIPGDAFLVGYASSISGLQKTLSTSVSDVEPQMGMMVAMAGPASSLNMMVMEDGKGPGSAGIKMDGPVALFAGPETKDTKGSPLGAMIFEVADASKVKTADPSMHITRLGSTNWIAVGNAPFTPGGGSSLLDGLVDASVAINIDQARLVEEYRDEIDGMLAMMAMPQQAGKGASRMAAAQQANVQQIKMLLDRYTFWNVGLDLNGAAIDLLLRLHPKNPADVARGSDDLGDLTGRIPTGMAIEAAFDKSALTMMMEHSTHEAGMGALPPAMQAAIKKIIDEGIKSMALLDSGVAFGISMGNGGMDLVQVVKATDPEAVLAHTETMVTALNDAGFGLHITPRETVSGKGYTMKLNAAELVKAMNVEQLLPPNATPEQKQRVQMEMAQGIMFVQTFADVLFGEDGWKFDYEIEGDYILTLGGPNEALRAEARRIAKSGGAANTMTSLAKNALASPSMVFDLDARQVADEVLKAIASSNTPFAQMVPPSAPAGSPVPFSMVGSSNGQWEQVRIRTNAKDWYVLSKDFQPKEQPAAGAAKHGAVLIAD